MSQSRSSTGCWLGVLLLAQASCGQGVLASPVSGAEHRVSAAAHPAAPARPSDWERLSWEERHDQMTWMVLPNMARLFQGIRGTQYPELTCRSCHGPDGEANGYRMPNALPALDPERMLPPGGRYERGHVSVGMADQVTPTMARLLGKPSYDASTKRGFGCLQCHPSSRR